MNKAIDPCTCATTYEPPCWDCRNKAYLVKMARIDAQQAASEEPLRRRIADLEALIAVFVRKGQYHMQHWPGDKEMEHTLEKARAVVGEVGRKP